MTKVQFNSKYAKVPASILAEELTFGKAKEVVISLLEGKKPKMSEGESKDWNMVLQQIYIGAEISLPGILAAINAVLEAEKNPAKPEDMFRLNLENYYISLDGKEAGK